MARTKGSFGLAGAIEPKAAAPLDARDTVKTKEELTMSGSFPYSYIGMETFVTSEMKKYRLIGTDPTVLSNWEEVGTGGSDSVDILKAAFDELPQEDKDNGSTYFIPDATVTSGMMVVGNRFDKANIYTATERLIGSWMGKPLYQRTVIGKTPSATGVNTEILNLSTWGIDQVISFDGHFAPGGSTMISINYYYTADNFAMVHINDQHQLTMKIAFRDHTNKDLYITLRYTKTTDGEVEFGTETDYSTDERIIGTWINGKKIYQKTVSFGALPNNSAKYVEDSLQTADILQVIDVRGIIYNPSLGWSSIPYVAASIENGVSLRIDKTDVKLRYVITTWADKSSQMAYITIQYTKTTD